MMATTHAFVGLALSVAVALVAPELALPAAVGGALGGLVPDVDLLRDHRKDLHFPVYYSVAAGVTGVVALLAPGAYTVGAALFFLAAAIHAASDALGGGLELRPWEGTSDRAVYVHPTKSWARPRRLIRYDGAPEDVLVGAAFALPGLLVYDGVVRYAIVGGLAISAVYALVRKPMVEYAPEWLR